jgi:3',5'-cyclic AMP phosphodiesterase CpdA
VIGLPVIACAMLAAIAQSQPPPQADTTDVALFLIGDAGVPRAGFEPVLAALQREVAAAPGERVIVFLGDNIYPRGLPDSTDLAGRIEAERRLTVQVVAAESSHAKTIFVPGNHDWDAERPDGLAAIRREAAYVRQISHNTVLFLPANGCPGPAVFDAGTRVRLLLLDTQWWLQAGPKPQGPPGSSGCPAATSADVVDSIRTHIATAGGRSVVVLAHHPIYSGGAHGEHWNIGDYLGSGPVLLLRRMVNSAQDFRNNVNTAMRQALSSAFDPLPPLLYVSGHDHGLQVLTGRPSAHEPLRYIVSGAGDYDHLDPTRRVDRTRWEQRASGYVRVDFYKSGTARLAVHVVDAQGGTKEAYTETLQ